jgi:hypothetical protein
MSLAPKYVAAPQTLAGRNLAFGTRQPLRTYTPFTQNLTSSISAVAYSKFRASDWVIMEAPAITTLPPDPEDDESPPPPPPQPKFRVKLRVSETRPEATPSTGGVSDEDEEDQLIDDDDLGMGLATSSHVAPLKAPRQRAPRGRKPKAPPKEKDKAHKDDPPAGMMSAWQIKVAPDPHGTGANSPDPSGMLGPSSAAVAPAKPGRKRGAQAKKGTPATTAGRIAKYVDLFMRHFQGT